MQQDTRLQRRNLLIGSAAGAAGLLLPSWARAEDYPARPITFVCPWPAGGTADQSMRAICQIAAKTLGQSIAVENRAGAAGMIGAQYLATARPDGYVIGQIPISVTRFSQIGTLKADPRKDFTYLARTNGQTFGIAVLPDSKFKTLKELGYNVVVDAPNGIGAPKGLPPEVEKKLRDAFRGAIRSEEFKAVAARIDSPVMYLDGPEYQKYVMNVYDRETQLIQRLKLKELMEKG